jgi:hypothetical protein
VLAKDDEPVACETNGDKDTSKPLPHRTMGMALWFFELVQGWIWLYSVLR